MRFLALTGGLLLAITPLVVNAQEVEIPDAVLREVLRERLDIFEFDPITQQAMLDLPEIFIVRGADVRDLTGMEFALNTREIVIENGLVETFEPLAELPNVTRLVLSGNPVISLDPVRDMTLLTTLEINTVGEGTVSDLCPLFDHPSLTDLMLENQNVFDVCPLGTIPNLSNVNLDGNPIENITALTESMLLTDSADSEFITMRNTDLDELDCSDIVFLRDNSVQLQLSDTVVDCSTVKRAKGTIPPSTLPDCDCAAVGEGEGEGEGEPDCSKGDVVIPDPDLEDAIRDALNQPTDPLTEADLAALTELNAVQRGIRDLTGLECAVNLERLDLELNLVEDLSPLAGLTQLEALDVSFNRIPEISPLADLTQLVELDISNNQIEILAALSELNNLRVLVAGGNPAPNIAVLPDSGALVELELEQMGIENIDVLQTLTGLDFVNLNANPMLDTIQPLVDNPGLDAGDRVELLATGIQGDGCTEVDALADRGVIVLAPVACVMNPGCPGSKSARGASGVEAAVIAVAAVGLARRRRSGPPN